MATLKEIKSRIASVGNTLKTTSAMKMVASAKLHRVQGAATALTEYEHRLSSFLSSLYSSYSEFPATPLTLSHATRNKATLVVLSSDTSLCGGFNAQAITAMNNMVEELYKDGVQEIEIIPVGAKVADAARKAGYNVRNEFVHIFASLDYAHAAHLANKLMEEYISGLTDCIYVVYNHFHSMGKQLPQHKQLLPITLDSANGEKDSVDYICEPDKRELLSSMIPYTFRMNIYGILLDSACSEHAARTVAMQTASENAQKLLNELRLEYNKRRQQNITNELADITQIG